MLRFPTAAAHLVLLYALAGCAGGMGPPPITDLGVRTCTATPDFSRALPVSVDGAAAVAELDATAPCLTGADGMSRVYAVFLLPPANPPYFLSVASQPVGAALFPPRAQMLGSGGEVLRDVDSKLFLFRGNALTAQLRSHEAERYLLVTSVPELVGTQISRTGVSTSGGAIATGNGGFITIYSGTDVTMTLTFSLNGRLVVSATRAR